MILEPAILTVRPGQDAAFEAALCAASALVAQTPGYPGHQLQRCLERPDQYVLLGQWATLEDHTTGLRGSPQYQQWRALLHHCYDPFPTVEHDELVFARA